MKVLNKNDYQEIRTWIHRNARELELSVWNYFFENGSREAVIDALSYYQNEDGGFGHAVEPDGWNPESSPYATLVVTGILRRTGAADAMGAGHPMMQGIFRYLESGAGCDVNGWMSCATWKAARIPPITAGAFPSPATTLTPARPGGAMTRQRISFRAWGSLQGCVHLSFITENRSLRFIRLPWSIRQGSLRKRLHRKISARGEPAESACCWEK